MLSHILHQVHVPLDFFLLYLRKRRYEPSQQLLVRVRRDRKIRKMKREHAQEQEATRRRLESFAFSVASDVESVNGTVGDEDNGSKAAPGEDIGSDQMEDFFDLEYDSMSYGMEALEISENGIVFDRFAWLDSLVLNRASDLK